MKWKYETTEKEIERKTRWHRWFAWRPVKYDGVAYWLQTMERKGTPTYYSGSIRFEYKYREPLSEFESAMTSEASSQCTSEQPYQ